MHCPENFKENRCNFCRFLDDNSGSDSSYPGGLVLNLLLSSGLVTKVVSNAPYPPSCVLSLHNDAIAFLYHFWGLLDPAVARSLSVPLGQ